MYMYLSECVIPINPSLSLSQGNFFQNLGSIILFAVVGTAISTLIVGGGLFGLGSVRCSTAQSYVEQSLVSWLQLSYWPVPPAGHV